MPIRINLLAEVKAEEELRRRDPVKRAIFIGLFLICALLAWSSMLYIRQISANSQLNNLEDQMASQDKQYQNIIQNEKDLVDITHKLNDLQRIYTNRFLWGSLLNALQQSVINDVQMISFRSEQQYLTTPEIKAQTNENGKITTFPKPGLVTQKISLQVDAKDSSATPGDQVGKYKEALAHTAYFQDLLGKTNEITLRNLAPPSLDGESGKTIVMFTLECRLPDKILK